MEIFIKRCNVINQILKCISMFVKIDPIISITIELICDYSETFYVMLFYIHVKLRAYVSHIFSIIHK